MKLSDIITHILLSVIVDNENWVCYNLPPAASARVRRLVSMGVRVRKVITRRTKRAVYKFPSLRQRRMIYCESSIEFDFAHLLEFDHGDVLAYREQPTKIDYVLEGDWHKYTPDFVVHRRGGREYVEVKKTEVALREDSQRTFRAIAAACAAMGYGFVVADSNRIRQQPRLYNVKLLWKYSNTPLTPGHQLFCRHIFEGQTDSLPLGRLLEHFRSKGQGHQELYGLIYWGVLGVDMSVKLTNDTPVFWPETRALGLED